MSRSYSVAVIGATGAVGEEFLRVLADRAFPISDLRLFASPRSAGRRLPTPMGEREVLPLADGCFRGCDVALFSAGAKISREWGPKAAADGALVVDNSSAFRMDPEVPLVVPEVNPEAIAKRPKGIVANPNCSTIVMLVPVAPLHRLWGVRRIVASTYQAVSGAGARAIDELRRQSEQIVRGEAQAAPEDRGGPKPGVFPRPIAFNVAPHHSAVGEDGFNEEERKMRLETKKILGDESVEAVATCVRVSTYRAHAESLWIEFARPVDPAEARAALAAAPGIRLRDDATPLDAAGGDDILVGRIRRDPARNDVLLLWVVGDQLRKGAAQNAVQIAEIALGLPAPKAALR